MNIEYKNDKDTKRRIRNTYQKNSTVKRPRAALLFCGLRCSTTVNIEVLQCSIGFFQILKFDLTYLYL